MQTREFDKPTLNKSARDLWVVVNDINISVSLRIYKKIQKGGYMRKYELLANYAHNQRDYLEQDIQQLQENLRYRTVSQVDCLELIIAQERLTMFVQVMSDIRHILGQEKPQETGHKFKNAK